MQASKHILKIRSKYFKERNFSVVMTEIFQDIANISALTGVQFLTSFVTLFRIIAGIVALMFINWQLTLILISIIPIKMFISNILFKKQEAVYKIIMGIQSYFSSWIGESISGITEIKMWGLINKKLTDLAEILEDNAKTKSRMMFYGYVDSLLGSSLTMLFTCVLYVYGAFLIIDGSMTIGMLVAFISYSSLVFEPVSIVSYIITQLSTTKPAFERFLKFLGTDAEVDDSEAIELDKTLEVKHIKFENVTLVYEQDKALDNVSFTINKGEKVAIIGLNGSGKSSLINLLLRFYEPSDGSIKINDSSINEYTFESYRSIWSLMSQSSYLFNDTIERNINITSDLSEKELLDSSRLSGALSFIEQLPEKFNTRVGYNGSKLSGGERQKVALARTMSKKNTKILLLDEATSSFDYSSEQLFNSEILSSQNYDIMLIVTHRPEILQILNKIIYLENGKVAGVGTYDELMQSSCNGFKNMLCKVQGGS